MISTSLQRIDKALRRWYIPLTVMVCLGLLLGHTVHVVSTITIFHLSLAATVIVALLLRAPMPKLFYVVAGYFLLYGVWTWLASLLWGEQISAKETMRFFSIPVLVIALSRVMLISPRKMLKAFFYVCNIYLIAMGGMGYIETFTGWHLPTSACPNGMHQASGLCFNQNDYSVMLIMAALYIFAYCSHYLQKKWHIFGLAAIGACIPIMLWNDCRTGLAVSAVAIVFYYMRYASVSPAGTMIKNRKVIFTILIIAAILAAVAVILNRKILDARFQIYCTSFVSLYDSYGIGFGINGDKHYLSELNNYNITRGLTNAHTYLFQILFTSGLPIFLLYCLMTALIMKHSSTQGYNLFWIMPIFYLLLLFSPSSSLYLWGHYLFFCIFICYAIGTQAGFEAPLELWTPAKKK